MNIRTIIYFSAIWMAFVLMAHGNSLVGTNTNEVVFTDLDFDAQGHASQQINGLENAAEGNSQLTTQHSVTVKVKDSKSGKIIFIDQIMIRATSVVAPPGKEADINVTVDRSRQDGRDGFIAGSEIITKKLNNPGR